MVTADITKVKRGTTRTIEFLFKTDGVAIDISGFTIIFTVKCESDYDITDSKAVIQQTKVAPSDATSVSGSITFTLTPDETRINEGNYLYDIRLIDVGGNESIPEEYPANFSVDGVATNKGV